MILTAQSVLVTMAEIATGRGAGHFHCSGLGSCIAVCALDPQSGVGGVAHIMLPKSNRPGPIERPAKYADTGLPALIDGLTKLGGDRETTLLALVGGAQVLQFNSNGPRLDIGSRNAAALQALIEAQGLKVIASDLGGTLGRTLHFALETGEVRVRTLTEGERSLCKLKD